MTYSELSDNFKKFFAVKGGTMGVNDGFGLIRGTDTVWIKDLRVSKESPVIPIAHVTFDMNSATVHNVETGETLQIGAI